MFYTVRCYKNTGFNAVDIPASPSVLDTAEYKDFDNVDVVQNRGLNTIRINATYDEVKDIDYCKIGDTYYVLTAYPSMLNDNVCELNLAEDFITTCGGITQDDFITGTVDFGHSPTNDIFSNTKMETRWTPSKQLEIVYERLTKDEESTVNSYVESTLAIPVSATQRDCTVYEGNTVDGEEVVVSVPNVTGVCMETNFGFYYQGELKTTKSPNTCLYNTTNETYNMNKAIGGLRKLGLSEAILAQYKIPNYFVEPSESLDFAIEVPTNVSDTTGYLGMRMINIKPMIRELVPENELFKYEYTVNGYTPKNKTVYNGDWNSYTLHAMASGETITSNPEELYYTNLEKPTYICTADLRSTGSPIFYPTSYKGSINNLMMNNIKGLGWETAQDVFYGAEGNALNVYNYRTDRDLASFNRGVDYLKNFGNFLGGGAKGLIGATGVPHLRGISVDGNLESITGVRFGRPNYNNMLNGLGQMGNAYLNERISDYNYQVNRERQAANMLFSDRVVAPSIHFPRSNSIRDWVGNGAFLSRTYLSYEDLVSLDNFKTMNGDPIGKLISDGDYINNREYFNYLSMSNISLKKTGISMLERDGLAAQLSNCRLWKILPTNYNINMGNPITEEV